MHRAAQPARTVDELRELRELTGDENGAQRVAWTETWERGARVAARQARRCRSRTSSTRPGTSGPRCAAHPSDALLIGGHIDSVPNGGWLDGCLNVMAGVEVLRRIAEEGKPPSPSGSSTGPTRRARGSAAGSSARSAAAGSMADQDELRERRDADGIALPDALARARRRPRPRARGAAQLENAAAYLELHIEQGPVLESMDLPLGVVLGTFGVERHHDHLSRAGRARRLDADGPAPRRAGRRGEAGARRFATSR